jgi:hypothetical protein
VRVIATRGNVSSQHRQPEIKKRGENRAFLSPSFRREMGFFYSFNVLITALLLFAATSVVGSLVLLDMG